MYDTIVLHYSASDYEGQTAAWIDAIHSARGFDGIGYHFFIRTSGLVERGRPLDVKGAHSYPNTGRLGICFAGGPLRVPQNASLREILLPTLKVAFPNAVLKGHDELNNTLCPRLVMDSLKEFWDNLKTNW